MYCFYEIEKNYLDNFLVIVLVLVVIVDVLLFADEVVVLPALYLY